MSEDSSFLFYVIFSNSIPRQHHGCFDFLPPEKLVVTFARTFRAMGSDEILMPRIV